MIIWLELKPWNTDFYLTYKSVNPFWSFEFINQKLSYSKQADATLEMEQRDFIRAGLEYVCLIQEVQERKKFEFVETVSYRCS